ncbi:MAG: amidohydrolase [Shimia sp.]|uniref:amidohydrolase n=1 Tax=Shimia sp. TaxID=1954381 RepID=UPI003B8C2C49
MDESGTVAEAIGIEDGEIVYVGGADGLRDVIGLGTEVIDLDGNMVIPGFVESHMHVFAGGLIMNGVDLQSDDSDEVFDRLRAYVSETEDEIVMGYGVRFTPWKDGNPTAAMLDEIESERPVYLWAIDGHKAWVNSKALEMAGVDKDTPDTVPGFSFFERDADGNPTGWIVEIPAQMQMLSGLVEVTPDLMVNGMKDWIPRFAASGITTMQDLGFQGIGQDEGFKIIEGLVKDGSLPFRIRGVYYWNDGDIDPVTEFQKLAAEFTYENAKPLKIKINVDGGDDSDSALYVDGYADNPDTDPDPIIPRDVIIEAVVRADALGIDAICHCFGDGAVRIMLDAVEAAIQANPERDRRFSVAHGNSVHPDDIPRFAELGVFWNSSGAWMSYDPNLQLVSNNKLGKQRVQEMFPMKKIADAGGRVVLGADWPVSGWISEYRPLVAIETAVTRTIDGRKDVAPLGGAEAGVSVDTALRATTINPALELGMENVIGSLEVGKLADLVVLDENLYEVDPDMISEVKVLYTMMDGELTWDHTAE